MLECAVKSGWDQFIEFVEARCSSAEFKNWIAPIRCIESAPEETLLEVPNIFVQEYLLDNFKDILADFLPLKSSGEPAIRFTVAEVKELSLPPREQAPAPIEEVSTSPLLKLNALYTFDHFIEGPSNQFVKSAAIGVAARPGKSYNPLL